MDGLIDCLGRAESETQILKQIHKEDNRRPVDCLVGVLVFSVVVMVWYAESVQVSMTDCFF